MISLCMKKKWTRQNIEICQERLSEVSILNGTDVDRAN